MKKEIRLFSILTILLGLTIISSCGDDEEPAPEDPGITLTASASDANRGQEVTFTGTVTAPGGFQELTASVDGLTVSGLTAGATGEQNFTASFTVPATADIGSTIEIDLQAVDALEQTSLEVTYTITVVTVGAPTISLTGDAMADLKRRATGNVMLNISAPDGLNELIVTDGAGSAIETVAAANIADPASYSYAFTVPDEAMVDGTFVLNFNVSDQAGQTSSTAATFTVNVQAFDPPTIAFKGFENGTDTAFSEASNQQITFTVTKDALVAFDRLNVAKVVNEGDPQVVSEDISAESGDEITYTFTVDEAFLDEVDYTFFIADEFGSNTDQVTFSADILTTDGASFLIDNMMVNGNMVSRVRGKINEAVTFTASNSYYVVGEVEVADDGVLTIDAGTTVSFATTEESALDIDDSGMINASGMANNPIVFTSGATLEGNTPEAGDWGFVQIGGEEGKNSGTFRYVRIEYAGLDEDPAFELDLVDDLTNISHVQVFKSGGQGIEVNGGNISLSNIIVTDAAGISLELDDQEGVGYTGNLQYILINSPTITEKGGRDFEARDGADFTVSNMSLLAGGAMEGDISAVRFRDDFEAYKLYNILIFGYSDDGIRIDYTTEVIDYEDNTLSNSYIFQIGDQPTRTDFDDPATTKPTLLVFETDAATFNNVIDAGATPAAATGIGVDDFIPDALIPSAFDPTTLTGFSAGTYVGAFDGTTDWTAGWSLNADGSAR
ncbi:MAG: hypothetical protein AAFQ94_10880 [Bacteroidota bacterium]